MITICGIAWWSKARRSSEIADTRALAAAFLVEVESRGRDASGVAWLDTQRVAWWQKNAIKGSVLASQLSLPGNASTGMVHARFATKGAPSVNSNNHPIVRPGIVMVHNGHITNDDALFASLKVDRIGEVDSEAIAASIMHGPGRLSDRLAAPHGNAAIAWMEIVDQEAGNPQILHLARMSTSPMVIGTTAAGDLLGASTRAILTSAAKKAGVTVAKTWEVPEWTYMKVRRGVIEVETALARPKWDMPFKWTSTESAARQAIIRTTLDDWPSRAQLKAQSRGAKLFPHKPEPKPSMSYDQFLDEWVLDEEDYAAQLQWRSENEWRH